MVKAAARRADSTKMTDRLVASALKMTLTATLAQLGAKEITKKCNRKTV